MLPQLAKIRLYLTSILKFKMDMDKDSAKIKEVIKVIIVGENGTEREVDPSSLNFIELEISKPEGSFIKSEQDDEFSDEPDDIKEEGTLLLENIKVEMIEDPQQEFGEYLPSEKYSELEDNQFTGSIENISTKQKLGGIVSEFNKRKIHRCDICGYKSFQKSHYRRHLAIHSKPDGIQCSICRKGMIAKAELTDHMEEHRCSFDRDKFQCHLCSYTSKKVTNVSQHTEIHFKPQKTKNVCERCDFSTTNRTLFKKHLIAHKNSKRNLRCPVCLTIFKTMSLRRKHIQKYKSGDDPNKFQCPECSYNTAKFHNFKQHMVVHRSEYEIDMFLCPYCPFKSKRKTDLRQHVIVKHKTNDEVILFRCDFCSYESRRGNHLTSHMKNRHAREIIIKKCGICSYKTVSQVLIEKHCNIHSKVPEHFFLCNVCGSGFLSSRLLDDHMEKFHSNSYDQEDEAFADDDDDYVYKNKSDVEVEDDGYSTEFCTVHIENDDGEKEEDVITMFCCQFPQCNFKTVNEKEAKIHKTISHNKRGDDNRCPECTFHTTSRYLYLDHLKVHKIDIEHLKPHLCDICGSRWIRQGDLTRHMSVHWGSDAEKRKRVVKQENPNTQKELLECPFCAYTTRLRLCMYKHMSKHGEEHQRNFSIDTLDDSIEEYMYEEIGNLGDAELLDIIESESFV